MNKSKQVTLVALVTLFAGTTLWINSARNDENTIITALPTTTVTQTSLTNVETTASVPVKKVESLVAKNESVVLLVGEVGFSNSQQIASQITFLSKQSTKEPIVLIINSPGGAVFGGAKIINAIEASKRPVWTVCDGLCASMGAMIHSYGTRRLITDRSVLMYHNAAGGVQGSLPQMYARLAVVSRIVFKMEMNISKRSGLSYDKYKSMISGELWLDGEDSVNLHLSDSLVALDTTALSVQSDPDTGLKSNKTVVTPPLTIATPNNLPNFDDFKM